MDQPFLHLARLSLIEEMEQLHGEIIQLLTPLTEEEIWRKPLEHGNSVGHLVLHLTGNLNHYVGAQVEKTGYVRNREREFSESQPPSREELLSDFASAVALFRRVVEKLNE